MYVILLVFDQKLKKNVSCMVALLVHEDYESKASCGGLRLKEEDGKDDMTEDEKEDGTEGGKEDGTEDEKEDGMEGEKDNEKEDKKEDGTEDRKEDRMEDGVKDLGDRSGVLGC
ncbi:uncharacterized protein F5891DRAFT_976649 [Suillus fuscotomentosus]|uniref:Uncharacterized protein n=1 Tax=Suillus fuscotomentosus TaxID=1912939 RepID=A0AAD4EF48_9AGAM|nr:uncharacterized protein F5891DRAFT_976649 [Suillus fuscotomentosus]KAG1905094.1 hypothetical protein F5891DRAFT_976649 [Suillus fuscotomentosus]